MKHINFRWLVALSWRVVAKKRNAAQGRRRAEDTLFSGVYAQEIGQATLVVNHWHAASGSIG